MSEGRPFEEFRVSKNNYQKGNSMMLRSVLFALAVVLGAVSYSQPRKLSERDAELYQLARTNLKGFAERVSGGSESELQQAQAIVAWLAKNFAWTATDYQKRTVQEIIDRQGGNCDELAGVAVEAMTELRIRMRKVREINIHVWTPARGVTAHQMVKEKGNRYSVFGRHHNDHVWIEIYDSKAGEWFPADPSIGVVGTQAWLRSRVWFGKRFTLNPVSKDMIVPFVIVATDDQGGLTIDRTRHYLVDEFNRLYDGRLERCKDWDTWASQLSALNTPAIGAFHGETNLHDYESRIDTLAAVYDRLRAEYAVLSR